MKKKKNKIKNNVAIDEQNMFVLALRAKESGLDVSTYTNKYLDAMLFPNDTVLFDKIMPFIDEAMAGNVREDYGFLLSPVFERLKARMNINSYDFYKIKHYASNKEITDITPVLSELTEIIAPHIDGGIDLSVDSPEDIISRITIPKNWEQIFRMPEAYDLISELLKHGVPQYNMSLSTVLGYFTLVTHRPAR